MTMPSEPIIRWHDKAGLYGLSTRIVFFEAPTRRDCSVAERTLGPFMDTSAVELLHTEEDRKNFRHARMVGQPDSVFSYKNGLISLEYKSRGRRPISRDRWREQVRLKDMLQCIIAGYLCAQVQQRVTACILRYENAALLLTPCRELVELLESLVPQGLEYYEEPRAVSASELASFAEQKVLRRFGDVKRASAEAGKKAHEALLNR